MPKPCERCSRPAPREWAEQAPQVPRGKEFPAVGLKGHRFFSVGSCQSCGLALFHDEEADGPTPKRRRYCGKCALTNGSEV